MSSTDAVWRGSAVHLFSRDGVRLNARVWDQHALTVPAAGAAPKADAGDDIDPMYQVRFVVAHGFTGHSGRPAMQAVARVLAAVGTVLCLDLRGHGDSQGLCTIGAREVLDVDAGLAWFEGRGDGPIVTVGFSMGASVVVRHAAGCDGVRLAPAAAVSVSGPAFWGYRGTAPMRLLHTAITTTIGRTVLAVGRSTRMDSHSWATWPQSPAEAAAHISVPLLVVHGDADRYFPREHADALVAAAPDSRLWWEPGFGHAEDSASAELIERIGRWSAAVASTPRTRARPAGTAPSALVLNGP